MDKKRNDAERCLLNLESQEKLRRIEKIVGRKLEQIDEIGWGYCDDIGYVVNKAGEIDGLGLYRIYITNEKLVKLVEIVPELSQLDVSWNKLTDISVLSDMTNLIKLNLEHNKINNCSVLKYLGNLTHLDIGSNELGDISFLEELGKLTHLRIGGNNISDLSGLRHLSNLRVLNLWGSKNNDLSFLKELINLEDLDLNGSGLKELFDTGLPAYVVDNFGNGIHLYGNPLENPPVEVIEKGRKAVMEYFENK